MVIARKYVVKNRFLGYPKLEDYEIVEEELPPIQNGEIMVQAEWVSVDPYQRSYNMFTPLPYDQFSLQVGTVIDSKDPRYPVGTKVVSHKGWCDYSIVDTSKRGEYPQDTFYKLPDLKEISPSAAVGAIGMPGITAYFGFIEMCNPKPGETVVVTGAAGAVGIVVGQLAKIKGCKVIGFAGTDNKCNWLEELGFDKAINYKTNDIEISLREAAPEGVDIYFDNVGGEISTTIMTLMNFNGRVTVCGSSSTYNETESPKATTVQMPIIFKQLNVRGIYVWAWMDRWPEAFPDLIKWVRSGELKSIEHVVEGFENIFDTFLGILKGENYGKAVIKL